MRLLASTCLLGLVASAPAAGAQDVALERSTGRWRIQHDRLEGEAGARDVELLGVHHDFLERIEAAPELYLGLGGFAAVGGDRGGFFAGGITLGVLEELFLRWYVDAGVFLGGGGKGDELADGWLVRPHVGVERAFGPLGLRAEASAFDADEAEPTDVSLSLGLTLYAETLAARAAERDEAIPGEALVERRVRTAPRYLTLDPDDGSRTEDGAPLRRRIEALGLGLDYFLGEHLFLPFEAYGAVDGGVGGFALAMAGLGVSIPVLSERLALEAKASLGAGGGGGVDAGGGLVVATAGGVHLGLTDQLGLEASAGTTSFPDGELDASSVAVGLSWSTRPLELVRAYPRSALDHQGLSGDSTQLASTHLSVYDKVYVPPGDARKNDGSRYDSGINLFGVGAEVPVGEWVALTGRAFTAVEGDVGGYKEGLLGARIEYTPMDLERHHFRVGGETGAGGGGGVDVASGLLFHFSGGYRYDLGRSTSVSLEFGKAEASRGTFEAESWTFGLGVDLQRALAAY